MPKKQPIPDVFSGKPKGNPIIPGYKKGEEKRVYDIPDVFSGKIKTRPLQIMPPDERQQQAEEQKLDAIDFVVKTLLPGAADIAGAMAGSKGLSALPKLAPKLIPKLMARGGGAAVGGFSGELAAQKITQPEKPLDFKEAAISGLLGGVAEGLQMGGGAITKKIAPPIVDWLSRNTGMGAWKRNILSNKFQRDMIERSNNFLYEAAPEFLSKKAFDPNDTKLLLAKAKEQKDELYSAYKEPLREAAKQNNGIVLADKTNRFLREEFKEFAGEELVNIDPKKQPGMLRKFLRSHKIPTDESSEYARDIERLLLKGQQPTSEDFIYLLDNVNKVKMGAGTSAFTKFGPRTADFRTRLKSALMDDMEQTSRVAKETADRGAMDLADWLTMAKIIDKATKLRGGKRILKIDELVQTLTKEKPNIQKMDKKRQDKGLQPLWPKVSAEIDYYAEQIPKMMEAQKTAKASIGQLGRTALPQMGFAGGVGLHAAGPWGVAAILVPEIFGLASSYALFNPAGRKAISNFMSKTGISRLPGRVVVRGGQAALPTISRMFQND
jgi:hypothetical protein